MRDESGSTRTSAREPAVPTLALTPRRRQRRSRCLGTSSTRIFGLNCGLSGEAGRSSSRSVSSSVGLTRTLHARSSATLDPPGDAVRCEPDSVASSASRHRRDTRSNHGAVTSTAIGSPRTEGRVVPTPPTASELLANPDALLSSSHLHELGLGRRAIDAVWRACPVIVLPGTRRPLVRVRDYLELVEASTCRGDRVRP
jgi:hypothetical protein